MIVTEEQARDVLAEVNPGWYSVADLWPVYVLMMGDPEVDTPAHRQVLGVALSRVTRHQRGPDGKKIYRVLETDDFTGPWCLDCDESTGQSN